MKRDIKDKEMLKRIIYYIKRLKFKIDWRKNNLHNETTLHSLNYRNVEVGKYTYGALQVLNYNENVKLKIGNFCSIGGNVLFLLSAEHKIDSISTYPFKVRCLHETDNEAISKGDIIVDDDVWIGQNAIILSGVHIGKGAVVAAGAVVTKNVPPYAIVGGNPAQIIKYRFSEDIVAELLKVDYSKLTKEMIRNHINDLYDKLESSEQLEWMPKK